MYFASYSSGGRSPPEDYIAKYTSPPEFVTPLRVRLRTFVSTQLRVRLRTFDTKVLNLKSKKKF